MGRILSIEVIFKHTLLDKITNLFRRKGKAYPRVATFKDFSSYSVSDNYLLVTFGKQSYIYPMHNIGRIKVTYN